MVTVVAVGRAKQSYPRKSRWVRHVLDRRPTATLAVITPLGKCRAFAPESVPVFIGVPPLVTTADDPVLKAEAAVIFVAKTAYWSSWRCWWCSRPLNMLGAFEDLCNRYRPRLGWHLSRAETQRMRPRPPGSRLPFVSCRNWQPCPQGHSSPSRVWLPATAQAIEVLMGARGGGDPGALPIEPVVSRMNATLTGCGTPTPRSRSRSR